MSRSPLRAALPVVLLSGLLLPRLSSGPAQEALVIKGGTIIPVSGPSVAGGSLVIEKGRITALGKTVKTPAGARVVDATGQYVYPGLVAPMASLGLTGYPGAGSDINEIGPSTPYLDPFEALNPEDETIAVARVDGVTSCLTPAGISRLINGNLIALHLDGSLPEQMVLQRGVGLVFNTSVRQANAYPSTLEGVSRFFTDKLDKARQYAEKKKGGEKAVDPEMEALAAVLDGGKRVVFQARDEVPIRIALRLMADYKIKGILWTASNAIHFAFTDSTGLGGSNVRRLPVPAALSTAYGLPEEEALKAITLNPARIFGLDDRIGSLDVGKSADVVVCSKPILQASSKIKHVFIAGREIPRQNVQTRLRDMYRPLVEERLGRRK